eukprot:171926-Chlamydomonas_euryale.AAC.1
MAETDLTLREEIFTQVTRLVSVVKQHMRRFLPDLLQARGRVTDGGRGPAPGACGDVCTSHPLPPSLPAVQPLPP